MNITTFGLDLAKESFHVYGVDVGTGEVIRKKLTRAKLLPFFFRYPGSRVAMEACGGAHHWARELQKLGHEAKLIAPQFVKPFVMGNKNDANDAQAIWTAVHQRNMRFVAVKTVEQQSVLSAHRIRSGFVEQRTSVVNRVRGLAAEYGVVFPKGVANLRAALPAAIEDKESHAPQEFRDLLKVSYEEILQIDEHIKVLDKVILDWVVTSEAARRLMQIPGIGPITASALVAVIGNIEVFLNARQLSAYLGLVPRQCSTGGKTTLLGISKRGDSYIRKLLVHGARAVIRAFNLKLAKCRANKDKAEESKLSQSWLGKILGRKHTNVASVALANKMVRIVWAVLTHGREYDPNYQRNRTLLVDERLNGWQEETLGRAAA